MASPKPEASKAESKKAGSKQRDGEEPQKSAQDLFVENLPIILAAALIPAALLVFWTYMTGESQKTSDKAWAELSSLRNERNRSGEGFEKLAKEFGGTTAEPYIRIAWAARLYESGVRSKVEKARDTYEDVLKNYGSNPFIKRHLEGQVERINSELADPKSHWIVETSTPAPLSPDDGASEEGGSSTAPPPASAPAEKPAPASPEEKPAGDGHDHDHSDHDGHDHSKKP